MFIVIYADEIVKTFPHQYQLENWANELEEDMVKQHEVIRVATLYEGNLESFTK